MFAYQVKKIKVESRGFYSQLAQNKVKLVPEGVELNVSNYICNRYGEYSFVCDYDNVRVLIEEENAIILDEL